jgi:hypothetical protein
MKASELRIGNLVFDSYSGIMIVDAINPHSGMDNNSVGVYLKKTNRLPSGYYDLESNQ